MHHKKENARQKALEMCNRTEESAEEDVRTIKKWMERQPHLPETMDDRKIRNFLLLNKHSVEKCKQKIDMYYTVRSLIPDLFEDSNPKSQTMANFMKNSYCSVHPIPFEGLYRVYFLKAKAPHQFAPRELGLQCTNISEVRLYEDLMVGDIIIFDMATFTLGDLAKTSPVLVAKLVGVYEKVFSQRVKAAYVINSPYFVVKLMAVLKSVVKPKIFNRIRVCENEEILSEIFTKDTLPKDYGGEGLSLEELNELMLNKFDEYRIRFDELDKLRVHENLRPKPLDNHETLGFYGNFKQLNVD